MIPVVSPRSPHRFDEMTIYVDTALNPNTHSLSRSVGKPHTITFDEEIRCHSTGIKLFHFDDSFCRFAQWVLPLDISVDADIN